MGNWGYNPYKWSYGPLLTTGRVPHQNKWQYIPFLNWVSRSIWLGDDFKDPCNGLWNAVILYCIFWDPGSPCQMIIGVL